MMTTPFTPFLEFAEDIKCVRSDLQAYSKGISILYAVDFSEIFRYGHPEASVTGRRPDLAGLRNPRLLDQISRERLALTYLFRRFPSPLIVLDPYLVELLHYYQSLAAAGSQAAIRMRLLNSIARRVTQHTYSHQIADIVQKLKAGERLSADDRDSLAEIIQERYRDFWALLTSPRATLLVDRIKTLVGEGRIAPLARVVPGVRIDPEEELSKAGTWLRLIGENPMRAEKSWITNEADALACQYLETLNRQLINRGSLVVLITNDKTLLEIGTNSLLVEIPGVGEVRTIRGLGYVRTRLYCNRRGGFEINDEFLRREWNLTSGVEEMVRHLQGTDQDDELTRVMMIGEDQLGKFNNLQTFLATDEVITRDIQKDLESIPRDLGDLDPSVIAILTDDVGLRAEVTARADELWRVASAAARELIEGMSLSSQTFSRVLWKLTSSSGAVAASKAEQLLYASDVMNTLAEKYRKPLASVIFSPNLDVDQLAPILHRWGQEARKDPEAASAIGIVWSVYREWDRAESALRQAIEVSRGIRSRESSLLLMMSTIQRNKDEAKVEQDVLDGISRLVDAADARALRELGRIWWLKAYQEKQINLESLTGDRSQLLACIRIAKQALSLLEPKDGLRFRLYNDLAAYSVLLDLEEATAWVSKLRESLNLSQMPPDFLDTIGMHHLKQASVPGSNISDELHMAASMFRRALEQPLYLSKWQRQLVDSHLEATYTPLSREVPSI